jgi:hypothetical protein
MAEAVYLLCMLTSLFCALLLFRSYRASKSRLLFWSTLCFFGLAVNNALLVVDLILLPTTIDLSIARAATAFLSFASLLGGLLWEAR